MYATHPHTGSPARLFGVVASVAMVIGAGYMFSYGMIQDYIAPVEPTQLVIITPEKPQEVLPLPEVKEIKADVPPPPELLAPPVEFVPDIPPVIVAPPAPVEPVAPVVSAPAPTGTRTTPKLRAGEKPPYPAASIRASEQGTTKLELCVSAQGRVQSVSVAGTSGFSRLDEAAAKWVRNARFSPGTIGGAAQSMCGYNIFYEWNLEDARS